MKFLALAVLLVSSCAHDNKKTSHKKSKKVTKHSSTKKNFETQTITCKLKKEVRVLETEESNGGCVVHYEKFGEKSVLATAKWDLSHCTNVYNRTVKNLKSAGFSCD